MPYGVIRRRLLSPYVFLGETSHIRRQALYPAVGCAMRTEWQAGSLRGAHGIPHEVRTLRLLFFDSAEERITRRIRLGFTLVLRHIHRSVCILNQRCRGGAVGGEHRDPDTCFHT